VRAVKDYSLRPGDLAKVLQKSPKFIIQEILRGRLIGLRVGRSYRIAQDDFENYVSRLIVPPPPEYSGEYQAMIDPQPLEADDHGRLEE
jgi:hypothetical protein